MGARRGGGDGDALAPAPPPKRRRERLLPFTFGPAEVADLAVALRAYVHMVGLDTTLHLRYCCASKHQSVTAGTVRVTNLTPPGSDNPSSAYGRRHRLMTAGMVRVTNPVTPPGSGVTTLRREVRHERAGDELEQPHLAQVAKGVRAVQAGGWITLPGDVRFITGSYRLSHQLNRVLIAK